MKTILKLTTMLLAVAIFNCANIDDLKIEDAPELDDAPETDGTKTGPEDTDNVIIYQNEYHPDEETIKSRTGYHKDGTRITKSSFDELGIPTNFIKYYKNQQKKEITLYTGSGIKATKTSYTEDGAKTQSITYNEDGTKKASEVNYDTDGTSTTTVNYAEDGTTIKNEVTTYADSSTHTIYYAEDGVTKNKATTHKAGTSRVFNYAEGGIIKTNLLITNPDGTSKFIEYKANGITKSKETFYNADGSPSHSINHLGRGEREETGTNPDGTSYLIKWRDTTKLEETFYDADGDKNRFINYRSDGIRIFSETFYFKNGTKSQMIYYGDNNNKFSESFYFEGEEEETIMKNIIYESDGIKKDYETLYRASNKGAIATIGYRSDGLTINYIEYGAMFSIIILGTERHTKYGSTGTTCYLIQCEPDDAEIEIPEDLITYHEDGTTRKSITFYKDDLVTKHSEYLFREDGTQSQYIRYRTNEEGDAIKEHERFTRVDSTTRKSIRYNKDTTIDNVNYFTEDGLYCHPTPNIKCVSTEPY